MNKRLLEALQCKNEGRPPVWIMRQAGRYLPAYRALREKHSLEKLFHTPELAVEVTKLPLELFNLDAAIVFSDILVIAEAFGLKVNFPEKGGPFIEPPQDVKKLSQRPVEEALSYVIESIKNLKKDLKVPLLGFCGAPFTVASYMFGGEEKTKELLYRDPETFHILLNKLALASIDYLRAQIKAGVDAVQIFDSWANILSYPHFLEFSARYLKQIVEGLRDTQIPIILFCRGSSSLAKELSAINPAAISFDWQKEMKEIRQHVPSSIAVQGNFDPHLLKAPPAAIEKTVKNFLQTMKGDPGLIVNLGHGILPETPVENVRCFVETVANFG